MEKMSFKTSNTWKMRKFWKLFVVVCDLEIQGRMDFKVWLWGKKMPKIVCFQPKLWNFRLCFSNSGTLPFQLWIMLARQHSVVFTVRNSRANKKYCACKNFSTCWKRPEKTRSHLNYCTAVRWYLLGWLDLIFMVAVVFKSFSRAKYEYGAWDNETFSIRIQRQ